MTIVFVILAVVSLGLFVAAFLKSKRLEKLVTDKDGQIAVATQEAERARQHYESEAARVFNEAQASLTSAQQLVDQQLEALKQESERVRQHYETEARRAQSEADTALSKALKELEPLQKYEKLRDAEAEAQRELAEALKEATSLRSEAKALLEQSREEAADERSAAIQKAKEIREQADARLTQAIRDAGRIAAEAEKRAEQIGGDAYVALRDKQLLEQAAEAMRNVIEGYGDRYLVPTHSILDDFAERFGYDEAGKALKSARDQSRRMVEQGEAAACDYVEAERRKTAIQFVIHAFNGGVDAILTRVVKNENYGTLEQKIRDAFSIVNKDGGAFRNARILPAYLDARLAELKWAAKVQDLAVRLRDEQRAIRDEMRDEALAKKAQEEAARDKELQRVAVEEAEKRFAQAQAEQKAQQEQQLAEARQRGTAAVEEAEKRHASETAEMNAQHERQLAEERQKLLDATTRELTIAQRQREGSIYIISNEGSFGPGVYKIGFTRNDVEERVDDLYNASVPFEFDIHAVIRTKNAAAFEYKFHRQFLATRWNKKNLHKEFFRVSLEEIHQEVEKLKQQGEDCELEWRKTEAGRVAEWQESRDIENDSQWKDKWLKFEQAAADERWLNRERRLAGRRDWDALRPSALEEPEVDADDQPTSGGST
jgi:F0F1-type ATP synthase membrane subunit b/b'